MSTLYWPGIPNELRQRFTCDLAEKALLQQRASGIEPDKASWRAIQLKRLWLDGKASEEDVQQAWEAARLATWEQSWDLIKEETSGSFLKTIYMAAFMAAEEAVGQPESTVDENWQRQHLSKLTLEFFWKPFCEAVSYVAKQHLKNVENYQDHLEEALFS